VPARWRTGPEYLWKHRTLAPGLSGSPSRVLINIVATIEVTAALSVPSAIRCRTLPAHYVKYLAQMLLPIYFGFSLGVR